MDNIKDIIPYDVGLFRCDYQETILNIVSAKQLVIKKIDNSYANKYVFNHHYLKRKIYIARNVSYGLFAGLYCVGVSMFGYPVWLEQSGLCPPFTVVECPELIRLCTMGKLPKNTESYFLGSAIKLMRTDWKNETGQIPKCITSFCDLAFGFNGSIYKATNFKLHKISDGRPTNPGKPHGKWGKNSYQQKAKKAFYVFYY